MIEILQLCLIILIIFKLDSMNYYKDIRVNKVQKIDNNLEHTLKDFSHIIVNDNFFYKDLLIRKGNQYSFITNNLNITGTFLGSNSTMLFIANNMYVFEVDLSEIESVSIYDQSDEE